MAAACVIALEFVIDLSRSSELFLKAVCPDKRRRTVHLVKSDNFFGYRDKCRIVVKLLTYKLFAEHGFKLFGFHGFSRAGIEQRSRFVFHVGTQVVPSFRHFAFIKVDFVRDFLLRHIHVSFLFGDRI